MTSSRRRTVGSFAELASTAFTREHNALCWPRQLTGDFGEVARLLAPRDGVITVDMDALQDLPLTPAGRVAAEFIREDMRRLDELGRDPILSCITRYERDERELPIATDVFSFHADRTPVEYDTWLCTYEGRPSEGVDNDDARRRIDDPGVRETLRRIFPDGDDDHFAELVREQSFDLHYRILDGAQPFSFGVGHLWRIAVEWPGMRSPPCLHRAPSPEPGDGPRLLLIC